MMRVAEVLPRRVETPAPNSGYSNRPVFGIYSYTDEKIPRVQNTAVGEIWQCTTLRSCSCERVLTLFAHRGRVIPLLDAWGGKQTKEGPTLFPVRAAHLRCQRSYSAAAARRPITSPSPPLLSLFGSLCVCVLYVCVVFLHPPPRASRHSPSMQHPQVVVRQRRREVLRAVVGCLSLALLFYLLDARHPKVRKSTR